MDNRVFPEWPQIERMSLTEGEQALAKYLDRELPEGWEIFVQPFLNGDRPDIVVFYPRVGLQIFEVKDWTPGLYHSEGRDMFVQDKLVHQQDENDGTW